MILKLVLKSLPHEKARFLTAALVWPPPQGWSSGRWVSPRRRRGKAGEGQAHDGALRLLGVDRQRRHPDGS